MLRVAVALILIVLLPVEAWAQVSGSFALVSDYRYRGVSLSDGLPSAQAAIAYDGAGGWYAGSFAATTRLGRSEHTDVQWLGYAGYAQRLDSGLSWEAGAQYTRYLDHGRYAYPELYAGLAWAHVSARLYFAHDYFGFHLPVAYLDLNATHMLSERFYLFGHLGALRRLGEAMQDEGAQRDRFDLRTGIGMSLDAVQLQLGWTSLLGPGGGPFAFGYPIGGHAGRQAWTASLTYDW